MNSEEKIKDVQQGDLIEVYWVDATLVHGHDKKQVEEPQVAYMLHIGKFEKIFEKDGVKFLQLYVGKNKRTRINNNREKMLFGHIYINIPLNLVIAVRKLTKKVKSMLYVKKKTSYKCGVYSLFPKVFVL